jgi:hypothetical protein
MVAVLESVESDILRIRREFLDVPTLSLTVPQVMRLFNLRLEKAVELLTQLERDGFLMRTQRAVYRRAQPPMT